MKILISGPSVNVLTFIALLICGFKVVAKPFKSLKTQLNNENSKVDVFCINRNRSIIQNRALEFIVVGTTVNNSISLYCKFCKEEGNSQPKIWSKKKHLFTGTPTEIDVIEKHQNMAITFSHTLIIYNIQENDIGYYFCTTPNANEYEMNFKYFVDIVDPIEDIITSKNRITNWKNYSEIYFTPAIKKLNHFNSTFKFTLVSVWTQWFEYNSCNQTPVAAKRIGQCAVKSFPQRTQFCNKTQKEEISSVAALQEYLLRYSGYLSTDDEIEERREDILRSSLPIMCRSITIKKSFPMIYEIVKSIPDFVGNVNSTAKCDTSLIRKGPRYRKILTLGKGAHLKLLCPEADIFSTVEWTFNDLKLFPTEGMHHIYPGEIEPRIYVDSYNFLYLFDVTKNESGNFSCFVNNTFMEEIIVMVRPKYIFFTTEFFMLSKYLAFIFVICFGTYLKTLLCLAVKNVVKSYCSSEESDDDI